MGYGFLIFDSKESADKALSVLNGQTMPETNKKFKLNHASFNNRATENVNSVYVCELDKTVSAEQLISFFKAKYNSVVNGKIIIDPSTKMSKGYGFVTFSDEKEKEKALTEMNGKILNGKAIKTGNASYKKIDRYKSNSHGHQNLFIQQKFHQYYNSPYFMANNYFANCFNPVFQQQMYSQLEEFLGGFEDNSDVK